MSDLQDKIKADEAQLAADRAEQAAEQLPGEPGSPEGAPEALTSAPESGGSLELLEAISRAHVTSAKAAAQPTFMNLNSAAQASIAAAYALLGAGQMEEAAVFTNESRMHERAARSAQQ